MKRKSILLLAAVFIITLGANAQFYYTKEYSYYYTIDRDDHLSFNPRPKERKLVYDERVANNVKSSQKIKTNHKQDTISITNITYNMQ